MTLIQEITNWTEENSTNIECADGTKHTAIYLDSIQPKLKEWLETEKKNKDEAELLTLEKILKIIKDNNILLDDYYIMYLTLIFKKQQKSN